MSLRTKLTSKIKKGFDKLDDIILNIVYIDVNEVFSPITNTVNLTETPYSTKGIRLDKLEKDIKDRPDADRYIYFLILQDDLLINPKEGSILNVEGIRYTIIDISSDPASISWEFKCQE